MTSDQQNAKDDLAFMRAIVSETGNEGRSFGLIYLAAGILYGLQCVLNFILLEGVLPASQLVWLVVGIVPTVLFLGVNFGFVWKDRAAPFGVGTSKRAINAAFAGGGLANAILAMVIGWVAYQRQDWSIWFLFPIVVCAFQGAIWFAAAFIRRRIWYGVTAVGWFVSSFVLGVVLDHVSIYILSLGIILLLCMALPGYIILSASAKQDTP